MLKKEKLRYLDALKGFCILNVTFVHSGLGELPAIGKYTGDIARCVQLLFMVSAILTFLSLQRAFPDPQNMTKEGILRWYKKKLLRLLPQYYIALVLTMITRSWNTYWLGTEGHVTVWNILSHIFLVHGFFPHYIDSMLGVEWYLGVLLIYDFISPWLYKHLRTLEKSLLFLTAVFLIKPVVVIALRHIMPVANDPAIYNNYIDTFSPYAEFMVFIIGIVTYHVLNKIEETKFDHPKLIGYALLILAFGLIIGQFVRQARLLPMTRHEMFSVIFILLFAGLYLTPVWFVDNAFLRLWGRHSYTIFLFNFIVIKMYERNVHINAPFAVTWFIQSWVCNLILLGLALFLENYVDAPIQKHFGPKLLGA